MGEGIMASTRPRPKRYLRKLAARKPCVHGEPGIELRPHQVILRPLVTEKGTHQGTRYNAFTFMVSPLATKAQIKDAVEQLFNVRVEAVRTQNRRGKKTRFRQFMSQQADWKKAIVTLNEEDKIDFF
jgi:large subunit ribosomal protein L23